MVPVGRAVTPLIAVVIPLFMAVSDGVAFRGAV